MLGLMHAFQYSKEEKYLESVEKSFHYYSKLQVDEEIIPFYSNWQCQACKFLFQNTKDKKLATSVQHFVLQLQDELVHSRFFEYLQVYPTHYATVEVACALEGLVDAFSMCQLQDTKRRQKYLESIRVAVEFLLQLQNKSTDENARGGFGNSIQNQLQRGDVTGHVLNSFIKILENSSLPL